jgi:pilus assembly protein CpaF
MALPVAPKDASNEPAKKISVNTYVDARTDKVLGTYTEETKAADKQVASPSKFDLSETGRTEITWKDLEYYSLNNPGFYRSFDGKLEALIPLLQEKINDDLQSQLIADSRMHRGDFLRQAKAYITANALTIIQSRKIEDRHPNILAALAANEICGLGPLEPIWANTDITEVMVNGANKVMVELKGKIQPVKAASFRSEQHLEEMCNQILARSGRAINFSRPYEDGRLPDGSRVNAVHQILGNGKAYLTIRRFREQAFSVKDLVERNALTEEMAAILGNLIYAGVSAIIAGPTGSGKTTMLNALSGCIPNDERIITIEDNIEMVINPKKDVVALEARKGATDDRGEVTIRDLVKNALRMRPDRIIVGEVRDGSAYDMLQAMNTGHDGSMTTVHANDPFGAIDRIVNLISEVGEVDPNRALSIVAGGVDLIVIVDRFEDGSRRVTSVAEVPGRVSEENGRNSLTPRILWEFRQTGTDSNGMIVGEYVQINTLSDDLIRRKRLSAGQRKTLSIQEIYELSEHY